jgi:Uncharacterized protein conserved in bacteria
MRDLMTDPAPKYDDDQMVLEALRAPFTQEDVEFVPRKQRDDWAIVNPYVDARAVRRRLNRVLGAPNWSFRLEEVGFKAEGFVGTLRLTLPSGAAVEGDDAANMTDVEAIKGGASQALRRAASAVAGIGEYFYSVEEDLFVDYDDDNYPAFSEQEAYSDLPKWAKLLTPESQDALVEHAGRDGHRERPPRGDHSGGSLPGQRRRRG